VVEWPQMNQNALEEAETEAGRHSEGSPSHTSLYPWSWLYSNSYAPSLSLSRIADGQSNADVVMWGKGIAQQPPSVTWNEVMSETDESGVAKWLSKLVSGMYRQRSCFRHDQDLISIASFFFSFPVAIRLLFRQWDACNTGRYRSTRPEDCLHSRNALWGLLGLYL
jgi:hypothetical protein